jgi:hypothetical protein
VADYVAMINRARDRETSAAAKRQSAKTKHASHTRRKRKSQKRPGYQLTQGPRLCSTTSRRSRLERSPQLAEMTVARKKRRSPAQVRATKRMIAARRRKLRGAHAPRRRRQVTLRSRKRKGRRRAKIVIRTRPRKSGRGSNVTIRGTAVTAPRRRRRKRRRNPVTVAAAPRRRRRRRRRNPVVAAPRRRRRRHHRRHNPVAAAPRRRRRHHRRRRRHNPIVLETHRRHHRRRRNPLSGKKDFASGVAGLVFGGLIACFAYRFASTNPVTATASKDGNGNIIYLDTPSEGRLYNVEAPLAPIWTNWKALAAAGAGVVVPFGISSFVKGAGTKSFFQLAGFGALGFVGVKVVMDVATKFFGNTKLGTRLLAPEVTAHNLALATGPKTTNQPMNSPTMAGLPFGLGGGRRLPNGFRTVGDAAGSSGNWLMSPPPGFIQMPWDPNSGCPAGAVFVRDPANQDVPQCWAPPMATPPPPPPPPPSVNWPPPPPGTMTPPPPSSNWPPPPSNCPPGWSGNPPVPMMPPPVTSMSPACPGGGGAGGACCNTCATSPCACSANESWSNVLNSGW